MIDQAIREAEDRRCRAVEAGDMAALDALFSEDMIYVHTSGHVDTKQSCLADLEAKLHYHAMERLTYTVRDHGDVALATGELFLDLTIGSGDDRRTARVITSQVWVRSADCWQQAQYHASFLADK